jgi:hypothetical protein
MVAASQRDSQLSAIVKWIPIEVITVYKALDGVIPSQRIHFRFWFTIVLIPLCALWIAFATRPKGKGIAWRQVVIAPFAFSCWIAAIQTEALRAQFPAWEAWMGSVILGFGTLLLPILDGVLKALGVRQNS